MQTARISLYRLSLLQQVCEAKVGNQSAQDNRQFTASRQPQHTPSYSTSEACGSSLLVFFSLLSFVSSISADKAAECRLTLWLWALVRPHFPWTVDLGWKNEQSESELYSVSYDLGMWFYKQNLSALIILALRSPVAIIRNLDYLIFHELRGLRINIVEN